MLAIRMQRTGRKGHANFRVLVQDSRQTPTSGKFVAHLGSYDPHTKTATLDKEKAAFYLEHGAQPSDRVVSLLKQEGVKIPAWVKESVVKTGKIRNQEKLRKNRTDEPEAVAPADDAADDAPAADTVEPAETPAEAAPEETTPEAEAEKPEVAPEEKATESEADQSEEAPKA